MPSRKIHRVKSHCRIIRSGRKAKSPCTRNGQGGTTIKGHWSPKNAQHSAILKIQAMARGRGSRRGSSGNRRPATTGTDTAARKITAAFRKLSKRRSAERKKAAKLAKALKKLA